MKPFLILRRVRLAACALAAIGLATPALAELELNKGDRICYIGNNLADRMQHDGWLETLIQTRFPNHELVFRNLGFTADEVNKRPRSANFRDEHSHLTESKADVVFCFFGYNESYKDNPEGFAKDLRSMIDKMRQMKYNGESAPKIVLFSPIAHEDLKSPHLPDGSENNARLARYTSAMAAAAKEAGIDYVDLFAPTQAQFAKSADPLTMNGIHLTTEGNRFVAKIIDEALFGAPKKLNEKELQKLRAAVIDKNYQWFNKYRTTDGYNVYGGRSKLNWHGQSNADVMKIEMEMFAVRAANRDKRVWAIARGKDLEVKDDNLPEAAVVNTNRPNMKVVFQSGEDAIKDMTVHEDMEVNLFASEEQFPELINPVQMAVDTDGRLWAAVWPTYPHWNPAKPLNDKLVILKDNDNDGKCDELVPFAENLNSITGFEFWGGGVLVAVAPEILFLKDTDGDDRADVTIRMLQGVSSADSHHTANGLVIGPEGNLYWSRGVFHVTNMETPTKTYRSTASGVYKFDPRTFEIDFHFPIGPNPHGNAFDAWGFHYTTDGTSGTGDYVAIGRGQRAPHRLYQKRVRPVPASGILGSSHFGKYDGNFLICNAIGFLGVLQHEFTFDGADITAKEIDPILVSKDPNFRPTDVEIGGDGALYVSDWQNPLIGHMQHNMRDPLRDHSHGRVYRVTRKGAPLTKVAKMKGKPIPEVLDWFKSPDTAVRYRARLELSGRDRDEVTRAAAKWAKQFNPAKAEDGLPLLNALWVHEEQRVVNADLLRVVLNSTDVKVRAAATRTLGHWGPKVDGGLELLQTSARDPEAIVRAEAVLGALSFEGMGAAEVIFEAGIRPTDPQLDQNLKYVGGKINVNNIVSAAMKDGAKLSAAGQQYLLRTASNDVLLKMDRDDAVNREILGRSGMKSDARATALEALSKSSGKSGASILIESIDGAGDDSALVADLGGLLPARPAAELKQENAKLTEYSKARENPVLRSAAMAALINGGSSPKSVYDTAKASKTGIMAFLGAVPHIADDATRGSLYPTVQPLAFKVPEHLQKPAAAGAVAAAGGSSGLQFKYYEAGNTADLSKLSKDKPKITGRLKNFTYKNIKGARADGFQVHYTGSVAIPTGGKYTFYTSSDDGSRLYINGKVVVNNDGNHGMQERKGSVTLAEGAHKIDVTYFDSGGGDGLVVSWQGPGIKKQEIPDTALSSSTVSGVRLAAINALGKIPNHDDAIFADMVKLLGEAKYGYPAINVLKGYEQAEWPAAQISPLGKTLATFIPETPVGSRDGADFKDAIALAKAVAAKLPANEAKTLTEATTNLNLIVVRIATVVEKMQYDKKQFTVKAGSAVKIIFSNPDHMPHNLLIVLPGAGDEIGEMGEKMGAAGFDKGFIPDSPKILAKSKLINSNETDTISFTAPTEPGDYEVVCTFPGHWRLMRGIMTVTK